MIDLPLITPLPDLSLTHGQVLWALCEGQPPSKLILDQFRYLRQVGIPFTPEELGTGRGNRLRYGYDHLIECGVALHALRQGMKPGEVATLLVDQRKLFRNLFRQAFQEQPADRIHDSWVKSRGKASAYYAHEMFLGIHDRYSETPLKYELLVSEDRDLPQAQFGDFIARYAEGTPRIQFRLSQRVLVWVAWALEAPDIKPGRK